MSGAGCKLRTWRIDVRLNSFETKRTGGLTCCSQPTAWPRLAEDSAEDADFDFTGDGRLQKASSCANGKMSELGWFPACLASQYVALIMCHHLDHSHSRISRIPNSTSCQAISVLQREGSSCGKVLRQPRQGGNRLEPATVSFFGIFGQLGLPTPHVKLGPFMKLWG